MYSADCREPSVTEDDKNKRLAELDQRIGKARRQLSGPSHKAEGKAWSAGVEFVGGVLVCSALGWWLDKTFETKPWGLIILMLLGFAVGTFNALRLSARQQAAADKEQKKEETR
jgi:ATP synthase protein I